MKESKNLKASKSNILVGLYLDQIKHEGQLNECLFGLANQVHPVDVVILDGGLSDKEVETLMSAAQSPVIKTIKTDKDGKINEEVIKAGSIEINLVKTVKSNFSKIFNDIFNLSLEGGYEAFSIIEYDDATGANWYKIANVYMKENEDVGFFLPMIRNFQNGNLMGLMNEACWAEGISEEAGKFDMNLLLRFNCANPLGGLYRVEHLKQYSEEKDGRFVPMKESVKISHYYEFFLRMIYNDIKMMTVPRVGYDFRVNNMSEFSHSSSKIPNNITAIPVDKGGVNAHETSFWVELAKKEYFFDQDRNKAYEQQSQNS
ncbi:MAG: hypothetical protein AABY15_06115 [Nanoarchaeota archaeon]